jgi:Zinc finger C-x8-C-x5-C-x3-H type (and similar)
MHSVLTCTDTCVALLPVIAIDQTAAPTNDGALIRCPRVERGGVCERGDACPYAHNGKLHHHGVTVFYCKVCRT